MYLLIAILFLIMLITLFFISFLANKKTPVPKGCEDIVATNEKCMSCANTMCRFSSKEE